MRATNARELFRQLTKSFFANGTVTFTRQSRAAKTDLPLITITPGNVRRPLNPVYKIHDGYQVGSYLSRMAFTVDLFTHGKPVVDEETGVIAYENTAMDDMLDFADFLGSQYVIEWCQRNDVCVLLDGEPQDLTGLVNDNNYEYRSRLNVAFYFTQRTVGSAAVLAEESVLYPTEDKNGTGNVVYTPEAPAPSESSTGIYSGIMESEDTIVVPSPQEGTSGGGNQELANSEVGYFTEVEIKEETGNE